MSAVKTKPVLVSGYPYLSAGPNRRAEHGPFDSEESFPRLEMDVSRAGRVLAEFRVDRYVASSGWTDHRIVLQAVRPVDEDGPRYGHNATGVGDKARADIRAACEPVIREWLASDEYAEQHRRAAAAAIIREIGAPRSYTLDACDRMIGEAVLGGWLDERRAGMVKTAVTMLRGVLSELERVADE